MGQICTLFAVLKDKMLSSSGGAVPLDQRLCPWTLLGALSPYLHYMLMLTIWNPTLLGGKLKAMASWMPDKFSLAGILQQGRLWEASADIQE